MSSIDNAKTAMGWKAPAERANCANCKHAEIVNADPVYRTPSVICGKAGFYTKPYAICDSWADPVGVRG
jgi:hypothetical protein